MNPEEPRDPIPFWSWSDVALFAGLALPCLLVGAVGAVALGALSPVLKSAKTWTSMLLFYIFWFAGLWTLLKTRYDRPFWHSLGWVLPRRGAMASFMAGPLVAMSIGFLGAVLHTPQKTMPLQKLVEGPVGMVMFGLFSVVLGPVTEELAFRGFLLPLAIRSLGVAGGILAAALPFAVLHGPEYAWTWQYVVLVGFAGAVFGAVRYYSGSTIASTLMHSTYNLTFFAAFVLRGGTFQ
jgi:membrane protease YdiL (CAAX protease family)